MFQFQVKIFPNGLRLLMVPFKEALSFQSAVLVNTGSEFETKKINGLSHFLEHMCFKGTEKRPSNFEIAKALDEVGGSYNAFTSNEVTGYWVKVASQHQDLALDLVADIFLHSQFPEKEIEKEKAVVKEEINMHQDLPQQHVWDLWQKLLYGNQPAGWPILGTKENIERFSRKDLLNYHQQQYRAQSTLIVVSGKFSPKDVIKQVKHLFQEIPVGSGRQKRMTKEKQKQPQILQEERKTDQTHLIIGVRGINFFDPKRYALDLLDAVWDGGMSGILFQTIREKLGAAYYVKSIVSYNTDYGFWAVQAGINNNRLEEILTTLLKEWQRLSKILLSPQELKKAKNYLAGKIALSVENVHDIAYDYAFQKLLKNKIETPAQYLAKINSLSANDLRKVASFLLQPQKLNLSFIGPYHHSTKLLQILKQNF